MARISIADLYRKIADPRVSQAELSRYFLVEEEQSGPFDPALRYNPETVELPDTAELRARGDVILAGANRWARLRRAWAFESRLADGYTGPIIVSEGDSWFQYPLRLEDVIDHLMPHYAIHSLDAAGDTLQNMFDEREYLNAIQETRASVFLFSGGGNDVLGGGNLAAHLRDFDASLAAADHILPSYREVLDHAVSLYDRIFRSVEDAPGDILTLCHGYDRPIPNDGKWLGRPMQQRGIDDRAFQQAITSTMVERFNARLMQLAANFARVEYIDLRGVVGDDSARWDDELHPTSAGYADVAARFHAVIQAKAAPRSLAKVAATRRVTRTPATRRRALRAGTRAGAGVGAANGDGEAVRALTAPAVAPTGRQGLSLHVGLNTLDREHYHTDGALIACENDADDMADIARASGFDVMDVLKSPAGTRADVISRIEDAAKRLKAGDIFLFSYAGHGSQMPDFNRDEEDPEGADETFCLYDAMLVDDELYHLWGQFRDDVRVLVVSDSCHSGTNIRVLAPGVTVAEPNEPANRLLDPGLASRTLRSNRPFYNQLQRQTLAMNDGRLVRELAHPLRCSVLLLSGCQDNQVSLDGVINGRFTQELLRVWAEGTFAGHYGLFHKTIRRGMPATQSPNFYTAGRPNPAFLGQRPFSI